VRDTFLYGYVPYLVAAAVACALGLRFRANLAGLVSGTFQRLGSGPGAAAILSGAAVVVLGHGVGLLMPAQVGQLLGTPARLLAFELAGLVGGLLLAVGLFQYVLRRLATLRTSGPAGWAWLVVHALLLLGVLSGLHLAVSLRWGAAWYVQLVVPYLRSLLAFQPDAALLARMPWAVRLHMLDGGVLFVAVLAARWLEAATTVPHPIANPEETARQAGATP
jgi:nitrate reductase gamma subunit